MHSPCRPKGIPLQDITSHDLVSQTSNDLQPDILAHYAPRTHIYVRAIKGIYQGLRRRSLTALMLAFYGLVWVQIDGKPLLLFDLAEAQFHLFGKVFWPDEFVLLTLILLTAAFALFFVTALWGRVWCGFVCPQTAWSLWFIWLEEWFEGSRHTRIRRDQAPMTFATLARKLGKHLSWAMVALATGVTFVGYFYPIRDLVSALTLLDLHSLWPVFWVAFFTLATYINAGWLREQVCIYMCPYARFQSVMVNETTRVVAYDAPRGEPRRRLASAKNQVHLETAPKRLSRASIEAQQGDCVDCQLCVQVCPVGIDIRDGLQYECIACALCIDACDGVMRKLRLPAGLIRFAAAKPRLKRDGRTTAYGVALAICMMALVVALGLRAEYTFSVTRDRGALFHDTGMGEIRNEYTLRLHNRTAAAVMFNVEIVGAMALEVAPTTLIAQAGEVRHVPVTVTAQAAEISTSTSALQFVLRERSSAQESYAVHSHFFGPIGAALP